jgi:hypothetical protein
MDKRYAEIKWKGERRNNCHHSKHLNPVSGKSITISRLLWKKMEQL